MRPEDDNLSWPVAARDFDDQIFDFNSRCEIRLPLDLIAGFAEFGFIRPDAHVLLLTLPKKRGFDGYVRDPGTSTKYTLAVVDFRADRAISLAVLPAPPAANDPVETAENAASRLALAGP